MTQNQISNNQIHCKDCTWIIPSTTNKCVNPNCPSNKPINSKTNSKFKSTF